jgi:antitoxin FitA
MSAAHRRLIAILHDAIITIDPWSVAIMPAVTIRNPSDATHRALKVRAAHHGRSTEAEMRDILEAAVRPANRLRLGTALAEMS